MDSLESSVLVGVTATMMLSVERRTVGVPGYVLPAGMAPTASQVARISDLLHLILLFLPSYNLVLICNLH